MYETIEAQATQRRRQPLWAARSVSREEASITYGGGQGQGWRVRTWRAPFSLGSGWGFAWRAVSGARGLHEFGQRSQDFWHQALSPLQAEFRSDHPLKATSSSK